MTAPAERPHEDGGGDFLNTLALMLNVGAIISLALWLSMAGGGSSSLSTLGVGSLAVVLFAVSIVCFAVDQPSRETEHRP